MGPRYCSHTCPTITFHFFIPGPGKGLVCEVKHADITGKSTTASWHPVGPREGSQPFQDTSEGWRELLKLLSKDCPFSREEEKSSSNINFSPGPGDCDGRVHLASHSFQRFGDVSRATAGNSAPFRARATRPLSIIFQMNENCAFFL